MAVQSTDRTTDAMAKLEQGIKNLAQSGEWERYLKIQAAFHRYSFSNTLLILAQMPTATQVAGFNAWKGLGRNVRKGEKALWILAPIAVKKKTDQDRDDEADAQATERKVVGFRPVPVFDLSQTDGTELPTVVTKLTGDSGTELFERLARFNRDQACAVIVRDTESAANGFYDPAKHSITVDISLEPDQAAKTLCHETAHSILHRDIKVYREHRGDCELEAESVAFIVLHHFGIDSGIYSFGYVTGWQGGDEAAIRALKSSGQRIQATAKRIIDAIEAQDSPEAAETEELLGALLS